MKEIFSKEYAVFPSKKEDVSFTCKKCNSEVVRTVEIPEENTGDSEVFQCENCKAEYQTEVFSNLQGGYIRITCKD